MPTYLIFRKKNAPEESVSMSDIDDEMRAHFGGPKNASEFYFEWRAAVGNRLARSMSWDDIREDFRAVAKKFSKQEGMQEACNRLIEIVDWLEGKFLVRTSYHHGAYGQGSGRGSCGSRSGGS